MGKTLDNPIYIGKLHNGTAGIHPAIIEESVWYQVREVAMMRSRRPGAHNQHTGNAYVLSGTGRHNSCEAPLWARTKNEGTRWYRCSDRYSGGKCTGVSVKADLLEESFSALITRIHLPDDWQDAIRELMEQEPLQDEAAERRRLEQKLARTRRALVDNLMDYDAAAKIIRATEQALSMLAAPKVYEAAGEALTDLPALWPSLTTLERRNVAQSMLEAVYTEGTEVIRLSPKPLFVPLFAVAGY